MICSFFLSLLSIVPLCAEENEDYELYIAKGIQQMNKGDYGQALMLLNKALGLAPNDPEANYYAGIAASKAGSLEQAEDLLLTTIDLDETAEVAYLELIRLYYLAGKCNKAKRIYQRFVQISEDLTLSSDAKSMVKGCRERGRDKRYNVNLLIGGQDDSNVLLESDNPPISVSRKSDTSAVVQLIADAILVEHELFNFRTDYYLYQNLHRDLTNFDLTYQEITPGLEFLISDLFKPSVGYSLEYALLDGDDYGRTHKLFAILEMAETRFYSTELIYEYRDQNYWDTDEFLNNSIRTGHRNSVGIKQNFFADNAEGDFYSVYEGERTEADYWDYNGYKIGAEGVLKFNSLYVNIAGEYWERRYRGDFPIVQKKRRDNAQEYTLGFTYFFTDRVGLTLSDTYVINDSTLDPFEYDRNVFGIYLRLGVI